MFHERHKIIYAVHTELSAAVFRLLNWSAGAFNQRSRHLRRDTLFQPNPHRAAQPDRLLDCEPTATTVPKYIGLITQIRLFQALGDLSVSRDGKMAQFSCLRTSVGACRAHFRSFFNVCPFW